MPRRQRLDFKDAIHCVRLRGRQGACIFFDPAILAHSVQVPRQHAPGVLRFEALLNVCCEECAATLYAYCIQPNTATLVLQTSGAPLAAFMRRLSGQYSRGRSAASGPAVPTAFASRYETQVIAPEYLPYAVRRVHRMPVETGLCRRGMDYPFSSERAYTGEATTLPLDLSGVRVQLQQKGYLGFRGYRAFMDQEDSPYLAKLFAQGSPLDPRIVGRKSFVQLARYLASHPSPVPTREQLMDGVAQLLGHTAAELFTATHVGVLGRALVAWYGLRSGAATLTEMGRWFSVTGATLGQAMHQHRQKTPGLFGLRDWPPKKDNPAPGNYIAGRR